MIGFLCPTRHEYHALASRLALTVMDESGPYPLFTGGFERKAVCVCRCGVGKVAAAAAAQWLIDTQEVTGMLVCGAAGSLIPSLNLGDVIVGEEIIPADCGIWSGDSFRFSGTMEEAEGGFDLVTSYRAGAELLEASSRAEQDLLREEPGMRISRGRIVTCDQVTFSLSRRHELAEQFSAQVVEMEGAAIAQVAHINDLPFLALRGISDEISFDLASEPDGHVGDTGGPQMRLPDLNDPLDFAADRASRLAAALIRHLD